jgi:predicted MPP superfamily phosphohydrolase
MNASRLFVAVGVLTLISWLVHRYVWARLLRDASWPEPWRAVLTVAVFVLAALIPLTFVAMRWFPRALNVPMAWIAYTWMGFALYLLLLTATFDAARGIVALVGSHPPDPERRVIVARAIAKIVGVTAGLIGLGGLANVARGFDLRRVRVPIANLPPAVSGYCIETVVRAANALTPDMVVITGDLVDGSVAQLGHLVEPLRDLRAKDGVFFVTGNHEYYSGADEWIAHLRRLGIVVLRNERVRIRDAFDLAGVDDASAHRMLPHHGQDVAGALAGRDRAIPVVLLAHQPKALKDALAGGVDLQLSGHVHGGQMFPFNWLARLDQPLIAGLYRVQQTWVYVSTGTGYWGPPMRVGPGSEITRIELVSA